MTLYFIVLLGVLFHLIMKYRDAYTKKEEFDYKRQSVFSLFSIVTAFILVFFRDGIVDFMGMVFKIPETIGGIAVETIWGTAVGKLVVFLLGYFADSVWKNVENTAMTKLNISEVKEEKSEITPAVNTEVTPPVTPPVQPDPVNPPR